MVEIQNITPMPGVPQRRLDIETCSGSVGSSNIPGVQLILVLTKTFNKSTSYKFKDDLLAIVQALRLPGQ